MEVLENYLLKNILNSIAFLDFLHIIKIQVVMLVVWRHVKVGLGVEQDKLPQHISYQDR